MLDLKKVSLEIPNSSHEAEYTKMMDCWEATGEKIAPQLLSRFSSRQGKNVPYATWLEWCEDDRTTGSMLSTGCPCTLFFLVSENGEILGSIAMNHSNTKRGHLHAGIAPWHQGKGYGSMMLGLALEKCREHRMDSVDIVPYKGNEGAIKVILNNGGVFVEEFLDDGEASLRYQIQL